MFFPKKPRNDARLPRALRAGDPDLADEWLDHLAVAGSTLTRMLLRAGMGTTASDGQAGPSAPQLPKESRRYRAVTGTARLGDPSTVTTRGTCQPANDCATAN